MRLNVLVVTISSVLFFAGCLSGYEREYREWLASDDCPQGGSMSMEEFKAKYMVGWRERAASKKAVRLAKETAEREKILRTAAEEQLRRNREGLSDRIAAKELAKIRDAYAQDKRYENPFPREGGGRRTFRQDWLSTWTGPRRDLSEKNRLAGEALLFEFGTKYLPNAYANYEKARDVALELQKVFNEEFPVPWEISSISPKWDAFNKVLEKFAKVRAEYFLCRDELCHYWLASRLGGLPLEDLKNIDSRKLAVRLLPENEDLKGSPWFKVRALEGKYREFAEKYATKSFTIYQKFDHELREVDKLLKEVLMQCKQIDHVRPDRYLNATVSKRNAIAHEMNMLTKAFQAWQTEHRTMVKSSEDVAKSDHDMAMRLKPFINALPFYVKDHATKPVIQKSDMVNIPGKGFLIGKFEVTQRQWMAVMGYNPSNFKGDNNPVECVSHTDCEKFIEELNTLPEVKVSGLTFRLPSFEEWGYACRAGAKGGDYDCCRLADGTRITRENISKVAWYRGDMRDPDRDLKTHPVGQKLSNAFGLYDMYGNVREMCEDKTGKHSDSNLLGRGGSYNDDAHDVVYKVESESNVTRHGGYNDVGFRLAASQAVNR